MSRISLHQTHIELNNGIVDVTIPFSNELSDLIILVLKLNTKILRNNSLKDGMFRSTNISEALFILQQSVKFVFYKFSNLLRPLL